MNHSNKVMGVLDWGLLICLSILWSGSFFFGKVALSELKPFTVVLGRVCVAAIVLNIIVRVTGHKMPSSPKIWIEFLIMGLLNNLIPFSLIFWGQTRITSSLAAILNASTPVWAVLLAHFFTSDERFTVNRMIGVLFSLIGVVVMIGLDALKGFGADVVAQLAVLGAAISYSFAGIYGKRFKGIPPIVTASGQLTGTTIMMIPLTLVIDKPWLLPMPSARVLGALLGLALLCTALAYIIYFRLLTTAGAVNLLLVTFLIPIGVIILGTTFLNEKLSMEQIIGMGLIGLGMIAIDGRFVKKIRRHLQNGKTTRLSIPKDYSI